MQLQNRLFAVVFDRPLKPPLRVEGIKIGSRKGIPSPSAIQYKMAYKAYLISFFYCRCLISDATCYDTLMSATQTGFDRVGMTLRDGFGNIRWS